MSNIIKQDISPSDFAKYCYCGIKWALSKTEDKNESYNYCINKKLQEGRNNEKLCIDYLLKDNNNEIIFNGTGNNKNLLATNLSIYNKNIYSKPDIILQT